MLVPATVIGDDGHGYDLLQEVRKLPVDTAHVLAVGDRLTPTYTKPMKQDANGVWQELNRLDVRTRGPLSESARRSFAAACAQVFETSDGLIVLDQINEADWGVVNATVRRLLRDLARENPTEAHLRRQPAVPEGVRFRHPERKSDRTATEPREW